MGWSNITIILRKKWISENELLKNSFYLGPVADELGPFKNKYAYPQKLIYMPTRGITKIFTKYSSATVESRSTVGKKVML